MSTQTIALLSKNNATAERELKSAFGYAVFDNSNVTVFFLVDLVVREFFTIIKLIKELT